MTQARKTSNNQSLLETKFLEAAAPEEASVNLPTLVALLQPPERVSKFYWLAKRTIDVTLSSVCLVLGVPLFLLIAVAIKLNSPGPVLFRQIRMGQRLKCFSILKFRTMYKDVSSTPIAFLDQTTGRYRRPRFEEDPRTTKVGNLLRKFSLDELPQLLNIFLGDMSIIGPRPLALAESLSTPPEAMVRYSVPCGLTGLAQVRDRHIMLEKSRFDHDIEFVQTLSPKLDLLIFLKTFTRLYDRG